MAWRSLDPVVTRFVFAPAALERWLRRNAEEVGDLEQILPPRDPQRDASQKPTGFSYALRSASAARANAGDPDA
ncbi:MAG: hypothetical protein HRU00_07195 [Myxococcales bacterium]|nr:hypothetical protein [Myxococcales bacterium]